MEIITSKNDLRRRFDAPDLKEKCIGFVPTMGALHEGHLSLIADAKSHSDIVICSIFVNPTQFNDPKDLEKYPRPIENDIALLETVDCDILFMPTVDDMYPPDDSPWEIDLEGLDTVWEGSHRPGHFQGVTQVVYKLFTLVQPHIAFFGQKDFQQVMVIQHMVRKKDLSVRLFVSPTIRNDNGLALSSRNMRLSKEGLQMATSIYRALQHVKINFRKLPLPKLEQEAKEIIQNEAGFKLEYLAICETTTLRHAKETAPDKAYVVLVAAWLEGVRLIDNMIMD